MLSLGREVGVKVPQSSGARREPRRRPKSDPAGVAPDAEAAARTCSHVLSTERASLVHLQRVPVADQTVCVEPLLPPPFVTPSFDGTVSATFSDASPLSRPIQKCITSVLDMSCDCCHWGTRDLVIVNFRTLRPWGTWLKSISSRRNARREITLSTHPPSIYLRSECGDAQDVKAFRDNWYPSTHN